MKLDYPENITYSENDVVNSLERSGIPVSNLEKMSADNGPSNNYLVNDMRGKEYFCKSRKEVPAFDDSPMRFVDFLTSSFPMNLYRAPHAIRVSNSYALEAEVLDSWSLDNQPSVKRYDVDDPNIILIDNINGKDYRTLINSGEYDENKHLAPLIESISSIRDNALKKKDLYSLHNDLHLGNIAYDEDKKQAIAFDPGLTLDWTFPFQDLDANINLFFCYSLGSPHFFDSDSTLSDREKITSSFLDSLDSKSLSRMLDYLPISEVSLDFYEKYSTNPRQPLINQAFSPERQGFIKSEIKSRLTS